MNNHSYGLGFLNKFNKGGGVRHFYEGGEIDFGDMDFGSFDVGDMDFGGLDVGDIDLGDMDLGGLDFGDIDLGGLDLGDIDLGDVDLGDVDLGNIDIGDIDLGNIGLGDVDLGGTDIGDIDLGGTDVGDAVTVGDDIGDIDLGGASTVDLNELVGGDSGDGTDVLSGGAGMDDDDAESNTSYGDQGNAYAESDTSYGDQGNAYAESDTSYGDQGDADNSSLTSTSGDGTSSTSNKLGGDWQKMKDGRYVQIQDNGTAQGIDEDGNSFSLSASQVGDRIKSGDLNTYESGYNTYTGGNKTAPGGGSQVVLNNGKTGTLKTDGTVINNDTGKVIGTESDVKTVVTTDGDGKKIEIDKTGGGGTTTKTGGGGTSTKSGTTNKSGLESLLPLLLALLAMNRSSGGESKSTVIPGLTATQKQTPYTQQQLAPGYRPGQGGISYFQPTQYAPKMAAGGIARLLKGPGDGVSDSIPAVIGGMSRGGQPAKLARGEYVIDARTVAALGNGSTDAGAERLDKMRRNILRDDRKAGVGKDSKAYRHLMA